MQNDMLPSLFPQSSDNNQKPHSWLTVDSLQDQAYFFLLWKSSAHFLQYIALNYHLKLVSIAAKPLHCLLFDRNTTIKRKPSESVTYEKKEKLWQWNPSSTQRQAALWD